MASKLNTSASFSASRRWGIFLSVVLSIVAMITLVFMLNYLGAKHYWRFDLNSQSDTQLSPQTLSLLKYVTNEVKVIVYYDKSAKLYPAVTALLDEYHLVNPKISVEKVDYLVEFSKAQVIKDKFQLGSSDDKNLVIFSCSNGRKKAVPEILLGDYTMKPNGAVSDKGEMGFDRELKAFAGEKWFSAALLSVISERPMLACFLEGHGEQSIQDTGHDGYEKFAEVLIENSIQPMVIKLHGTNAIPSECNVLVIPGPRSALAPEELAKINEYLSQGGRMFVLFNYNTVAPKTITTGLEKIMADWNVRVGANIVSDPENLSGGALVISHFNPNHSLVAPLVGSALTTVYPRSIEALNLSKQGPDTPKVVPLAFSSKAGTTTDNATPRSIPIMVAVEKGTVKGVVPQRGTTAILVTGDSMFLNNDAIEVSENRTFAGFAMNWLLDQTQLLQGVGARPIHEYKLLMTKAQMASIRLIFLVVLPGSILAFGGLVWFRRRH